jgi:hypothetical protein
LKLVVVVLLAGIVLFNDGMVVLVSQSLHSGSWTEKCPASPFDWTHDHDRLTDLGGCRYAGGTVLSVNDDQSGGDEAGGHGDGDLRIVVALRPSYARLGQPGDRLQLEVVPAHRKHGVGVGVVPGDEVAAVGTWVLDTVHGWNELHPTTWVKVQS